ncbi:MAG: hypothetical protein QOI14_1435 [Actinomycetota bacterium]|nr:hypothetical protein [Actinomycetota bacterium]
MTTRAPGIRALRLPELNDASTAELEIDDERERERFLDTDLTGRDLMGIKFAECELDGVGLGDADLRSARFIESRLTRVNAPVLRAPLSTWREVVIEHSRVGSGELFESSWRSVSIQHCKIGYLNLRAAELIDVEFIDCVIDELDLGGSVATRVAFTGTSIAALDVARASLTDFDLRGVELRSVRGLESLRGATITELQLAELAPLLAEHLGMTVE